MGKLAYINSKEWRKKKRLTKFINYCLKLKETDEQTLESLCIYWFEGDGIGAQNEMRQLTKAAYYIILNKYRVIFGPVQRKLRQCAKCGMRIGVHKSCPYCGNTTWKKAGYGYLYYVPSDPVEKRQIIDRYIQNIDGNSRRLTGGDDFPQLMQNLVKQLGVSFEGLFMGRLDTQEVSKRLMAPKVTCPDCQGKSPADAKFCCHCGAKLTED